MQSARATYKSIGLLLSLLALIILGGLYSCTTETEEFRQGYASMTPMVSIDPTVIADRGDAAAGILSDIPDVGQLSLRVTSVNGQYSATWPSVDEYNLREPYTPGVYVVEAFTDPIAGEGVDAPAFYGVEPVNLENGSTATVNVVAAIASAIYDVEFADDFCSLFADPVLTLHGNNGSFHTVTPDGARRLFLRPGPTAVYIAVTMPSGERVEFQAAGIEKSRPQYLYSLTLNASVSDSGNPIVSVYCNSTDGCDKTDTELTPQFISSAAPAISAVGFTEGQPIRLVEGDSPDGPMGVELSAAPARSLILSTKAVSLTSCGWPEEIDLASASEEQLDWLKQMGLQTTRSGNDITAVDLSGVMSRLRSFDRMAEFSFLAVSGSGKIAGPLTMSVDVAPAELSVISVSDVVMGLDLVQVKLLSLATDLAENIAFETQSEGELAWHAADIISAEQPQPGQWTVIVKISHTATTNISLKTIYCGNEVDKQTITQIAPKSVNIVDAFAHYAVVKIEAENPEMLELIVSASKIYINGQLWQTVTRDPATGTIIVGGLKASAGYSLKTTMFDNPQGNDDFSAPIDFVTERDAGLPNGSFEDVDDGINYRNLPSGGRYSQNIVDIYNQQNHTSFSGYIPAGWANVNAKTFCRKASNYNTWYMYPSTVTITDATDGAYGVELRTVSFDVNGPAIPDYRQTSTPYVDYSRNIPNIANKAAGKIFLGKYSFDPSTLEEKYMEGIDFRSRPSSLNGYYRFIPSIANLNDAGLVQIEVIGSINDADIVIARASYRLTPASSYTAFTIPLTYNYFGVKAKRLKVMISSSQSPGSIAHESQTILTQPDPASATSHGGILWVDNLTFSY